MADCTCSTGASGMELIDCYGKADRVLGIAFQDQLNGGVVNTLTGTVASPLTQATWQGKLYTKDAGERISVLRDVKTYTSDREDPNTEEIDNISYVISEGTKTITFEIINAPYALKGAIESLACRTLGFYGITASNQILGERNNYASIQPIPIEKGTLWTKYVERTKTTKSRLMVSFQVAEKFNDTDFAYLSEEVISVELLNVPGMIEAEVNTYDGDDTTSTTTMDLKLMWALSSVAGSSSAGNYLLEGVTGMTTSSFWTVYNETTPGAVTLTSVTESATEPGRYLITFASAQTTADVIRFTASNTAPFNFTSFTKEVP